MDKRRPPRAVNGHQQINGHPDEQAYIMRSRRTLLAGAAAGGTALLAGCVDDLLDELLDSDIDAESEPAGISASVLEANGFVHIETESFEIDESFPIGDESIDLRAVSWVSMYGPESVDPDSFDDGVIPDNADELDEEDVVGVGVISTPSEEFAGQEVNPAGRFEMDELVEQFDDVIADGGVESLEVAGTREVTVLDTVTELTILDAVLDPDDAEGVIETTLYITSVRSGDDYVLPVGMHYHEFDAESTVLSLIEGVEHPIDRP